MRNVNFAAYCENPFNVASPVCADTEGLIILELYQQWWFGPKTGIQSGSVLYGKNEVDLLEANVKFLEYSFSHNRRSGITNWLILDCETVPQIQGMVTGNRTERRVYRPFAGEEISGVWGPLDHLVRGRILNTGIIETGKEQTYLSLLMSMLALCGYSNDIGRRFQPNVLDYSRQRAARISRK